MVAALIAALLSVPATAEAAPSPVAGEITTLKNELGRLIETQRQGPAPMDDQVATGMKENTEKAESQIASEPCQAADSLLAFARAGREQVRVLRDTIDGGGWNSDQLAQLTSTRTWLDRLGRQAGALRARIFTEIKSCEGPIDVYVDPVRAQPKGDSLPDDRPLASLTDSDGTSTDFVADELVVSTSEPSVLDAIVARYDGKVLNKVEQGDTMHYQVRIETKLAQPERLSDDLKAIDPDKTQAESVAVSSTAGLELLAAAASATSEKATVGVNWVGTSDDIPNSNTPEASSGPSGFSASGYDRNSYTWQYLNEGGPQDIGVTSAWTVLDSVGKLDNKIKAAVLDRGFDITADHPASSTVTSSVPGVSPSYQFSWEPRWHGTTVTDSMAAVPGNFIGTAGTAATVVRPTGVWTTGDMFYTMAAISQALAGGNKIINMSFSAAVPWYLAWSVLPFDGYTAFVRAVNDVLLFSSAGNDGKDVDATTGFIVKWEKAWHTPCENSGVTCVGGLAKNSLNRHADSNYGHEHVDIFAPYTVLAGPDPDNPSTSTARAKHGTSYATPYTAGVAALIWAANPARAWTRSRTCSCGTGGRALTARSRTRSSPL
ncbi:S8 family serine peptidase [Nonomuraea thailandensis]